MRIFICSTCYDLIDLRAELEAFFREAGVTPVLSDRLNSDFDANQQINSVETCLVNVRHCDEFVIILSSRYGPSLKSAGFADFSAMHLEYNEARKCSKPIHMYVRDRLEAEYSVWHKNRSAPDFKYPWSKEDHLRLFEILAEHRDLAKAGAQSNWLWIFKDSVELKARLAVDFKTQITRALVTRLSENGRVPFLEVTNTVHKPDDDHLINFELTIRNAGTVVALSPVFKIDGDIRVYRCPSLPAEADHTLRISHEKPTDPVLKLHSRLTYSIIEGHKFADVAEITVPQNFTEPAWGRVTYELIKRAYIGASPECQINTNPTVSELNA
jgi:hypothetical protein